MKLIVLIFAAMSFADVANSGIREAEEKASSGEFTIQIPKEHLASTTIFGIGNGVTENSRQTFAYFSAPWLSSHIDFYNPIISKGFAPIYVVITLDKSSKNNNTELLRDSWNNLWYGKGRFKNRLVTDSVEPNTGLSIITPISYKNNGKEGYGQVWYLSDLKPDSSKPMPDNPPWEPLVCSRSKGIIPGANVVTKCQISGKIRDDIKIQFQLKGENLSIREDVVSFLSEYIQSWIRYERHGE